MRAVGLGWDDWRTLWSEKCKEVHTGGADATFGVACLSTSDEFEANARRIHEDREREGVDD